MPFKAYPFYNYCLSPRKLLSDSNSYEYRILQNNCNDYLGRDIHFMHKKLATVTQ